MSFLRGTEEYYQKFLELQEKLRKSEEERLLLEMKFNEMVQVTREEEQTYYRKLRNQYKRFLEEDRRRQERNERIMRILERIESRAAVLAAKTERFELLRQQYQAYLQRVFSNIKHTHESSPQISKGISVSVNEQPDLYGHPISQKTIYEDELDNVTHAAKDLYEHPIIKRALAKKERNPLDSKLDVVKQYLRSLSSPMSGDEILKTTRSSAKNPSIHTSDLTDSNGTSSYRDDVETQEYYKTNTGKIADQIMNSINSRPRFSDAHYNKLSTNTLLGNQDRDELLENSFCGTKYSPKQPLSKNADYIEVFNNQQILEDTRKSILKDKEAVKKGEVRFQEAPVNENNITPDISEISPQEIADEPSGVLATSHEIEDESNYHSTFTNNNLQSKNIEKYDTSESCSNEIRDTCKDQDVDIALSNHDLEPIWSKEEMNQNFITEKEVDDIVEEIEEKVEDASDLEEKKYVAPIDDTLYDENISQEIINFKEEDQRPVCNPELVTHGDDDQDQQYYENNEDYPTVDYQENDKPTREYDEPIQHDTKDDLGTSNTLDVDSQQIQEEKSLNPDDKQSLQSAQHDDEADQRGTENIQYQDNGHTNFDHDEHEQQQLDQNKLNYPSTKYEDNQSVSHYDESGPPAMQYEENQQPASQYNTQQEIQYGENGQIIMQYDERGQPIMQYDEQGQPLMQYDEQGQPLMQYDESGQPIMQYDQNGQPIVQYDETGRPIMQYDENGQPIAHYDEHGQPMLQYDENGQVIMQYDESGQPLMQYDENGQPILGYDENGQPIINYDENGQPIIYDGHNQMSNFDVNGQPLYQYEQNEEYYSENQMYNKHHQIITEDAIKDEAVSEEQLPAENTEQNSSEQNCPDNEQKSNVIEEVTDTSKQRAVAQNSPNKERKHNVMEMLDTDTESVRQDTKISNDSDFDFSNN